MNKNYELIRSAGAVLAGVPARFFIRNLSVFASRSHDGKFGCGTLGCGAGLLAMHGGFNLSLTSYDRLNITHGNQFGPKDWLTTIAMSMGILESDAKALFSPRSFGRFDEAVFLLRGRQINDKTLILGRIAHWLRSESQPVSKKFWNFDKGAA